MTQLEDQLRENFRDQAARAEVHRADRAVQVGARIRREKRRRRAAAGGAAFLIAAGVAVGGVSLAGLGSTPDVASDPTRPDQDRSSAVDQLLGGATVPPGFDPAPLQPLAADLERDRVGTVTGVAQAVACAWTSRYAADPGSGDARVAVEELALSDQWVLLQSIAADNDYPSRVSTIAADLRRGDLRRNWAVYLRCDAYPGNTNVE